MDNRGEDETGNDPVDHDTDNDGVRDGNEQAGVIASFANNVLTINLGNSRTVQGTVDASTRITCESEDSQESHHGGDDARTSREPESGGNSGPGGGGSGDDGPKPRPR